MSARIVAEIYFCAAAHRLGQIRHRRRGETGAGNTCVVEGYVCVAPLGSGEAGFAVCLSRELVTHLLLRGTFVLLHWLLCLLPGRDSFPVLRWVHEPVIDFRMPGNLSMKILSAVSSVLQTHSSPKEGLNGAPGSRK
jgi:hypothetical protein